MAITAAWNTANYTRAKKLPDLKRVIRKIVGGRKRPQTPAEALRVAEALNALFGGKDLRKARK